MALPPRAPRAPVYDEVTPAMMFRVIGGTTGPGLVTLDTARKKSEQAEADLREKIGFVNEVIAAIQQTQSSLGQAILTEADQRKAADTGLQAQITALRNELVPFVGILTIPAGLSVAPGKSTRTVTVNGLKRNDHVLVTPNAALPATISMAEAYCAADNVLSVVLINSAALLSVQTAASIPVGILALRPVA